MTRKSTFILLFITLFSFQLTGSTCFAVDEDANGNITQGPILSLEGDEPPPPPKPKVIVKEKVVIQCAPGSVWSPKNKRCISEDGEAPSASYKPTPPPQQSSAQVHDDKYVYPRSKLRVRSGQCVMIGENMTCDITMINTGSESAVRTESTSIVDNLGNNYKATSVHYSGGFWPCGCGATYGRGVKAEFGFTYLDTRATSLTLTTLITANDGKDLLKLNVAITK